MRTIKALVFLLVAGLACSSTAFADVQLTIRDGRVSLDAKDATVRQILTEWARVGQTKLVNVERLPGGLVTLQLTNVSEQQALEVLLRSAGGYVLAPRAIAASNLSRFDRIIVMPASAVMPPSGAPPRAAVATPAPIFQQPQFPQPPTPPAADDDVDDDRPAPPVPVQPPNRGPVFSTFPQPQFVNPQQPVQPMPMPGMTGGVPPPGVPPLQQFVPMQMMPGAPPPPPAPAVTPTAPGGVARPGMIVPPAAPQQPGTPAGRTPNSPEG